MEWQDRRRTAHRLGRVQEHLKQIVYGGNDGIVTTFAIVAGFAGAAAEGVAQIGAVAVLVFGLANLFADAVSMGLGEFLSARSQADLYHARRHGTRHDIASNPEAERAGLVAILRRRGLPLPEAEDTATIIARHPDFMADLVMTYDTGLSDPADDTPALNGLVTFASFVVFGVVPLVPYFLFKPMDGTFTLSVAATLLALTILGLIRWNATGERPLRCVGETVSVGTICAIVAYTVGWLVGG